MMNPRQIAPLSLLLLAACGTDDDNSGDTGTDVGSDVQEVGDAGDAGPDTVADADVSPDTDVSSDVDPGPEPGSPVVVDDLAERIPEGSDGNVSVYQIEDEAQIRPGMSAQAMVGDWILESDRGVFVVEGEDRTMSPCPWGGSVIDAI